MNMPKITIGEAIKALTMPLDNGCTVPLPFLDDASPQQIISKVGEVLSFGQGIMTSPEAVQSVCENDADALFHILGTLRHSLLVAERLIDEEREAVSPIRGEAA